MDLIEAYFDESESHPFHSVAGYVFNTEQCRLLEQEWAAVLAPHGIKHFHMVECAHNIEGFAHLTRQECIDVETRLIAILKKRMACGFTTSFDVREKWKMPSAMSIGIKLLSPYALCCYFGLMHVRTWALRMGYRGEIAYMFEAGNANQGEANRVMNEIFSSPALREYYRYAGHSFVPKDKAVPLQCADLLAWLWTKAMKDKVIMGRKNPRKDLLALLESEHFNVHFDSANIDGLIEAAQRASAELAAIEAANVTASSAGVGTRGR
jgi:hypothetical protein